MSYGDYVEQLMYLLFLKMADERFRPPFVYRVLREPGDTLGSTIPSLFDGCGFDGCG